MLHPYTSAAICDSARCVARSVDIPTIPDEGQELARL